MYLLRLLGLRFGLRLVACNVHVACVARTIKCIPISLHKRLPVSKFVVIINQKCQAQLTHNW